MASPKYNDKVKAALAKRLETVNARLADLRPGAKAGAPGAGWGSVGLLLCTTAPPRCAGFANRFGGSRSASEAALRPNPSAVGSKKAGQLAVIGGRVASGAKVRTTRGRLSALRGFHRKSVCMAVLYGRVVA